MIIGSDIDDVLYPWYDRAHEICCDAGIVPEDEEGRYVTPSIWSAYEEYGVDKKVWVEVLERAGQDLYDAPPIGEALVGLQLLERDGHDIHFITARGTFGSLAMQELIQTWTLKWFRIWLPKHERRVWFSNDKSIVKTDAYIDDRTDHVERVYEVHGALSVVQNRPWNQEYETERPRVDSFTEFVELVRAREKEDA